MGDEVDITHFYVGQHVALSSRSMGKSKKFQKLFLCI